MECPSYLGYAIGIIVLVLMGFMRWIYTELRAHKALWAETHRVLVDRLDRLYKLEKRNIEIERIQAMMDAL